jgi:hypothetical protein
MNKDLFLAILAMDSYNRGYGTHINQLAGIGSLVASSLVVGQSATRIR